MNINFRLQKTNGTHPDDNHNATSTVSNEITSREASNQQHEAAPCRNAFAESLKKFTNWKYKKCKK